MFKTKIIAATLAVATLAGSIGATTVTAQAGSHHGIGLGIAAGALIGAAATAHAYNGPTYVVDNGYRRCKWVRQYDGYGYYTGTVKVCHY
jgi:hypothetical protein